MEIFLIIYSKYLLRGMSDLSSSNFCNTSFGIEKLTTVTFDINNLIKIIKRSKI